MGDAKKCEYCGESFTPQRSTGRFCGEHRKLAFKAKKRTERREDRIRLSAERAGIALSFDGRDSGHLRNGFGTLEIAARQMSRDRAAYYTGNVLLSAGREWIKNNGEKTQ